MQIIIPKKLKLFFKNNKKRLIAAAVFFIVSIIVYLLVNAIKPENPPLNNSEQPENEMNTPRVMMWSGKVNQHWDLELGQWMTDSDGVSGAGIDVLSYCKKFYPKTTAFEKYKLETTNTWRDSGNENSYESTRMSYRCVQGK